MSYLTRLDELRRAELFKRARDFAAAYNPDLPTIVILPGGMGSRLQRCTEAFDEAKNLPIEKFYELWCGFGAIFNGELRSLAQDGRTQEADRHPIIAAGELTNIVKSYNGIFEAFEGRANVVSMGYDWRRAPGKECAFVRVFLELLADEVARAMPSAPDPRSRLTLYAHSQGGLVAKLFIDDLIDAEENPFDWFERVVTCCTPFYGTNSHFSRYYIGEPLLNPFTGGPDAVARIVATFPGTYILLPAPREVLEPYYDKLGLAGYPVRDSDHEAMECDPFDIAMAGRYRPEVSREHLAAAGKQFRRLDRALPAAVVERVYHLRSDLRDPGTGTSLEMRWRAVDGATYGAYQGNPVGDNMPNGGSGDGTVPLWSAALAHAPAENVFTVHRVKHGGAAEHPCSLRILSRLMQGLEVAPGPHVAESDFERASETHVAALGLELAALPPAEAEARARALPPDEYRALVDGLSLSA